MISTAVVEHVQELHAYLRLRMRRRGATAMLRRPSPSPSPSPANSGRLAIRPTCRDVHRREAGSGAVVSPLRVRATRQPTVQPAGCTRALRGALLCFAFVTGRASAHWWLIAMIPHWYCQLPSSHSTADRSPAAASQSPPLGPHPDLHAPRFWGDGRRKGRTRRGEAACRPSGPPDCLRLYGAAGVADCRALRQRVGGDVRPEGLWRENGARLSPPLTCLWYLPHRTTLMYCSRHAETKRRKRHPSLRRERTLGQPACRSWLVVGRSKVQHFWKKWRTNDAGEKQRRDLKKKERNNNVNENCSPRRPPPRSVVRDCTTRPGGNLQLARCTLHDSRHPSIRPPTTLGL
jgi:hypothetical protein